MYPYGISQAFPRQQSFGLDVLHLSATTRAAIWSEMTLQLDEFEGSCIPHAAATLSRCFSMAATECAVDHKCPTCQMTQPESAEGRCNIDWHRPAEADTNLDQEAEEVGVRCSLARAGEPGPQGGRLRERQQLPYPSRCHAAL